MYYLIENTLKECPVIPVKKNNNPYVAILTPEQWQKESSAFDLGIDMDFETLDIHTTMAEVNYNSITGSFAIPYVNDGAIAYNKFAFVIGEDSIVFIDKGNVVEDIINRITLTRKWRMPSLERFIYDFLEEFEIDDRDFDDDNATVGGFAIEQLGGYPARGESFDFEHLTITVKQLQNLRVTRVLVKVNPKPEPEDDDEIDWEGKGDELNSPAAS